MRQPALADRAHFLALMSRVMRQVLVPHAGAHLAAKRGGGGARVPWDTNIEVSEDAAEQLYLMDLHKALEALEREDPPLWRILEIALFRRDDGLKEWPGYSAVSIRSPS